VVIGRGGDKIKEIEKKHRVRITSVKDDKKNVRTLTIKGNQGTAYVEETDKHYICKHSVGLDKKFETGSANIRTIEEGEAVEVLEGPKTETKEGDNRMRCRLLSDASEGWFTLTGKNVSAWAPTYQCSQNTVLQDGLDMKESKTLRKLEVGEKVEAVEVPVKEKTAGIMRVRVRAEKDGITGFATIKGNQGTVLLKPMLSEPVAK